MSPTEQKRLNREWRRRTDGRVALLLDSVQTPYNVGSIIRTAAAFRIDHVWLAGASAPPSHTKSRKTSLGTERLVTWSEHESVVEAMAEAKGDGYAMVGIELADGAVPLHEARLGTDVCLALGHEDRGLSPLTLAACDEVAFIPQLGKVGSLNVAVAASIALYEARRQAWPAPTDGPPRP